MTVALGLMAVPAPVDGDSIRRYETGTLPDGGLWTALTRLSNHDHTGGLNGAPISVSSIPDGSITTGKLDPSVLLPYALVDGSKPFTGQVTMQADAVVRDTLYFGQQGTALAPDVILSRTGAGALRVDTHLGVGVNPAAWDAGTRAFQVGAEGALWAIGGTTLLSRNTYNTGANNNAIVNAAALRLVLNPGSLNIDTAPAVAAGAAQTFTTRASIAPTGTLTLSPDVGVASLAWGSGALQTNAGNPQIVAAGAQNLELYGNGGYVHPSVDGLINLGAPSKKWGTVYASTGTISTSSSAVKEGITPLSPTECYQAAKDVRWYEFAYLPPAYQEQAPPPDAAYDEHDDNETKASKKELRDEAEAQAKGAYARMLVETAPARNQRGFVYPTGVEAKDAAGGPLPPVPELFGLSDRQSTTPQADLATLGCALQEVIRRLETLEAQP